VAQLRKVEYETSLNGVAPQFRIGGLMQKPITRTRAAVDDPSTLPMGGYGLPAEFNIVFERDGEVDVRLDFKDGLVKHVALDATAAHPEILASDVRNLPLLEFRDEAVKRLSTPIKMEDGKVVMIIEANVGGYDAAKHAYNRGRNRVNSATLARVAELAHEFPKESGDRGTVSARAYEAIRAEFKVDARAAQLWVKRARDKGLL
jgi:hypothetical protein